jgi:hypothetical protein
MSSTPDARKTKRIKAAILARVRELKSGVSFVELMQAAGEDAGGDYSIGNREFPNILFWAGVSEEFADAMDQLRTERLIEYTLTSPLVYLVDGRTLALPLAKRAHAYKSPHWLPMCVRLAPGVPK